jgi:hypothetical protein
MKALSACMLFAATSAFGQTQPPRCTEIANGVDRLACYDQLYVRPINASSTTMSTDKAVPSAQETGGVASSKTPPLISYLSVRDEGLPSSLPTAGPAFLGFVKNRDKESTVAKISAIFTGPALTQGGSGTAPFASLSISRDLTGSVARDTIGGRVGLRTTIFDYTQMGFAIDATGSVSARRDRIADKTTQGLLLDGKLVHKYLAVGEPFGTSGFPFQVVPRIGVGFDRVSKASTSSSAGQYNFGMVGASFATWPSMIPRLEVVGRYQYIRDFSASGGLANRRLRYHEYGLNFYLYDPNDEKAVFKPLLALLRESGDDPLSSLSSVRRTTLGLKFKVN